MEEKKYIDLKKTDWYIILGLFFLPIIIKIYYSIIPFQKNNIISFKIKHYQNNNEVIDSIDVEKTTIFNVQGKIGNITIEFDKEKGARVSSSTCPCKVCVNMGWSRNEPIICIPNEVIIQPINNSSSENNIDAITR